MQLPDGEAATLGLPVVNDLRDEFAIGAEVGEQIDAVSLDADLHLAAITPTVDRHALRVADGHGR